VFALEHVNPGNRDPSPMSSAFVAQQWHADPNSLRSGNSSTVKFHRPLKPGRVLIRAPKPRVGGMLRRSGGPEAAAMLGDA